MSCKWKIMKFAWWVVRQILTGRAPLRALLGHFQVSKWGKSRIFGKVCESTFPPNWNFWIWLSFSPPKLQSPNTSFCVSKMWQKVIFCLFFDFLEAQNLVKFLGNGWASVNFHDKSRNSDFSQNGVAKLVEKTCFLPKNHKWPKMLNFFWNLCWSWVI